MTAQEVFDMAMSLMDERDETTGDSVTTDTKEYQNRAIDIMNELGGELYYYSDTYTKPTDDDGKILKNKRGIFTLITSYDDEVDLDQYLCTSLLAIGLAGRLLVIEDANVTNFYQQEYERRLRTLALGMSNGSSDVDDVYNGYEDEYGEWHNMGYFDYFTRWH